MRTVRFLLFTFIYLLFNSYLYAQKTKSLKSILIYPLTKKVFIWR